MIRASCPRCAATIFRGVERDVGMVLLDVAPLGEIDEAGLVLASIGRDGWRRRRLTYDVLTVHGRDAPLVETRRAWRPPRPRGYVVIDHRCGQPPAVRLPAALQPREVEAVEEGPPFPPYADRYPLATSSAEIAAGLAQLVNLDPAKCSLCGGARDRKSARHCARCRAHLHGRVYAGGQPVVGWCEVGRHGPRRTVWRDDAGRWICGPCYGRARAEVVRAGRGTGPA